MSEEQISTMAKLYAERLMSGDTISESEQRVILAGLMLAVDRLTHAIERIDGQLWTEVQMRSMIGEEIQRHCAATRAASGGSYAVASPPPSWAVWLGRLVRAIFGR